MTPPAPTGWRTPARRGADAKIIVRIDHQALLRGHTEAGEVCEIAGLGPVPVASVTALMDDAFLAAVITKGHDVVTVAHLGRAPTAHQRTAVQARPQRCTTLGCARTARLELDHATPYVDAGHTFVPDLDPSCEHCHGLKTYEGYRHTPGTGPRPLLAPAEQADWNRRYPDNPIAPIRPPGRRGPRPHSAGHPDQATGAATADPENRSSSAPEPSAGRPTAEPLTLDLDIGPPPTAA